MKTRRTRVTCTVALLGLLAGCSSSPAAPPRHSVPGSTSASTTTTTIPSTPSSGCNAARTAQPPPGDSVQQVTTAGVSHPYLLSVPASAAPTRPAPLVLLFHGFGSDARGIAALTNTPGLGKAQGFVVATPDGPNHTWQLSGTGSDAAFVDDIVATVAKTHCIDMRRIYAAGFSQGAAFAIFYACAPRRARVAAIATVAVDFQLGCTRRLPILAFHGTADPAVPYENGAIGSSLPGVKVRGTLLNMGDWARLDRCGPTPTTERIGIEVTLKTWPHCTKGTAVALFTIEHGSHTWPGANPAASPLYPTQQIDATKLILRFFAQRATRGTSGQPKRTIESAPNARQ